MSQSEIVKNLRKTKHISRQTLFKNIVKVTTIKSSGFRCLRWENEEETHHVKSLWIDL